MISNKLINNIQNNVGSEIWLKWEGAKWEESKGPNLVIIVFIGSRCGCSSFQTKWLQNSSSSVPPFSTAWPFATTGSHFRTNVCFWQTEWNVWVWLTVFCSLVFLLQCWMNLFLFRSTTTSTCWRGNSHSHFTFLFLFVCLVKLFLFLKKRDGEGNEYDYYMGKFWVKGGRVFFGGKTYIESTAWALTK